MKVFNRNIKFISHPSICVWILLKNFSRKLIFFFKSFSSCFFNLNFIVLCECILHILSFMRVTHSIAIDSNFHNSIVVYCIHNFFSTFFFPRNHFNFFLSYQKKNIKRTLAFFTVKDKKRKKFNNIQYVDFWLSFLAFKKKKNKKISLSLIFCCRIYI